MGDQAEKLRLLAKSLQEKVQRQQVPSYNANGCRVITVTSGKGGVGKTNLALALSLALSMQKYRVALMDADMGLANVDVILGIMPKYNLLDVINGKMSLIDVIHEGPEGLKIIPSASGIEELANLDAKALDNLLNEIALIERQFDYLVIDTGAGISRQVMAFILAAEEILLVTTPEPTALTDAYGLIKVFKKHNGKGCLRLVINKVRSHQEGIEAAQRLIRAVKYFLNLDIEVAGCIPSDKAVEDAVRRNQSFIIAFPSAPASQNVMKIASIYGNVALWKPKRSIDGFMKQIISFLKRGGSA
ncbi:MAG: MinD/ParA family protein [Thermacetogeniaceae bacterium]